MSAVSMSASRLLSGCFSSSLCRLICTNSFQLQARASLSTAGVGAVRLASSSHVSHLSSTAVSQSVVPRRSFSLKVSAALVKKLRDRSAAPMGECKDALQSAVDELGANASVSEEDVLKKAGEFLQKKGVAAGMKLASRVGRDGIIALKTTVSGQSDALSAVSMIEMNSETDFAAKSPILLDIARRMTHTLNEQHSLAGNVDISSFASQPLSELPSLYVQTKLATVSDALSHVLSTLRESIKIRRGFRLQSQLSGKTVQIIGAYVHRNPPSESSGAVVDLNDDTFMFGKTAAVVRLSVVSGASLPSSSVSDLQLLANKLAMQVVAFQAKYIDSSDISSEESSRQLRFLIDKTKIELEKKQSKDQSETLIETIAQRRLKKYLDEFTLSEQAFVVYPGAEENETVGQILKKLETKLGNETQIKVKEIIRYQVGEGIEQEEKLDFAAEVQEKLQKAQQKK